MLKQLAQVSVEADGRYATAQELQFLKDYLQSVDQRISTYESVRDAAEKVVHQVEMQKRAINPNLFQMGTKDVTDICRRDLTNVLRITTAAMLMDDLDRLRDALLLWYRTIVRAFGYQDYAEVTYQVLQDTVKSHLAPEEADLMLPALRLVHSILTS
jgi:hypothetical protein